MTPTGRNRLLELLMQGVRPALRGDEPEQTGEILPLARYENGGVFPAVPRALSAIANSAQQGLQTDYMHPDPEVRQANTQQGVMDAFNVAGAAGTGSLAMTRPLGSVGAGGVPKSGLDMSHAARMARAKEMGFDTDAYHGTNSAFSEFKRIDGGNAKGSGYYFTTDPASASRYAMGDTNRITPDGNAGPNVLPVKLKGMDLFDESAHVSPDVRYKMAVAYNKMAENRALEQGRKLYKDEMLSPDEFAGEYFNKAYPPKGDNVLQSISYDPDVQNEILKQIGFGGRRSAPVGRETSGADLVVFDPKNIRSINAAFDPAKKDSSDILAALGVPIIPQDAEKQK